MSRHRIHPLATALVALCAAAPLSGQQRMSSLGGSTFDLELQGSVTTTAVSGDAGGAETLSGPSGSVLVAVQGWELQDEPCALEGSFASWWLDNGVQDFAESRDRSGRCRGRSAREARLRQGLAVTGVRICQRRQNDRLKGVEFRAAAPTGSGLNPAAGARFERTNCNEWQSWVDCPSGQVATGLVVHRDGGQIEGLGLRCRTLTLASRAPSRTIGVRGSTAPPRLTYGNASATSSVSGTSGTVQALLAPGDGMTLHSLSFGERNDKPCLVAATFRGPDGALAAGPRFDRCGGSARNVRRVEIPDGGTQYFVASAVKVCHRNSNDRLKGIRLEGSRVDASGATHDPAINDSEQRTNCNDWRPTAFCPQTTVAVGVEVHYLAEIPAQITGLSLRCRAATYGR